MTAGVTAEIARMARRVAYVDLPPEVRHLARLCLLDWVGVAIAGANEPLAAILRDEFAAGDEASLLGTARTANSLDAALINGSASHALDYDDFHLAIIGHPSVAIYPAVFALAESRASAGTDLLAAFVAGYETACRVGLVVAPSHYDTGFHATATVGSFGAAAACAHLMGLDAKAIASAMGIAATQAAGLKAMFGTMCKPLHAGRAAYNGLFAARAAARGFGSRTDIIECPQGFAATQSRDFCPQRGLDEPAGGWHLLGNVFKYHAACGATHSAIEAARAVRDRHAVAPAAIRSVRVCVDPKCDRICNIADPRTGLEAKFSLRQTVALALAGYDTGDPAVFSDELANAAELIDLRRRIRVEFPGYEGEATLLRLRSEVEVELDDGRRCTVAADVGSLERDLSALEHSLRRKFEYLASPCLSAGHGDAIAAMILRADEMANVQELGVLLRASVRKQ